MTIINKMSIHFNTKGLEMSRHFRTFVIEKEINNKLNPKTRKGIKIMKENNLKEETKRAWRELAEEWLEALEETSSRMGA